ncbi:MAG: AAA family ATPase [Bacillota bacterium]
MRFTRLSAFHFRCLGRWESPDLVSNLVVVLGRNESGKSTIFDLVQLILYGCGQSDEARRLFVAWDSGEARCLAELVLDSGAPISVERRIGTRVTGTIVQGGRALPIGNTALPWVSFMPREVFAELYTLNLDRLRMPDKATWEGIQDQLLGGRYGGTMRPLSQVILELESDANKLWRPDNRGNPLCKQIREQLRRLNAQRHDALQNQKRIQELQGELSALTARAEELSQRQRQIKAAIEDVERLAQVHLGLERVDSLLQEAGDVESFADLPRDLLGSWHSLNGDIERLVARRREIEGAIGRNQEVVEAYSPSDALVIQHEAEISELGGFKEYLIKVGRELVDKRETISRMVAELEAQTRRAFGAAWDREIARRVWDIDERELRRRIEAVKQGDQHCRNVGAEVRRSALYCAGAFAVVLVAALGVPGALGLAGGAALLLLLALAHHVVLRRRLAQATASLQSARECLASYLRDLPISRQRILQPDEGLILDITRVRDLWERLAEAERSYNSVTQTVQDLKSRVQHLAAVLGVSGTGAAEGDPVATIGFLTQRLSRARDRERLAVSARQAVEGLTRELAKVDEAIQRLQTERQRLLDRFAGLPGDSVEDKLRSLERRRGLYLQAQALLEEIRRTMGDPEALRQKASMAAEERDKLKVELAQIDTDLSQTQQRVADIRAELVQRHKFPGIDEIEGETQYLEEQRQAATIRRDRLLLLKRLLELADKQFREEHQPDVLQRASAYVERITQGKYTKVFAREDGKPGILLKEALTQRLIEACPPLSRGTLEQTFLSLRLAMLDHLDAGWERLPLLLDEAFVNWDEMRTVQGLNLLVEVSKIRQVFFFTCHRWLAEQLCRWSHAQLIELG